MKILIVSYGSIGKRHYTNVKFLAPKSEIKIFRTKNNHSLKKNEINENQIKKFNPDLVIINSPANKHFYYFKKFYDPRRAFFIEKPLESSLKNFDKNFFNKKTKFLMIGYVLRFDNILHKIKNLIKKQSFGKVYLADIKVGQYLPDWRKNKDYKKGVSAQKKLGGGALLELSHEIDYATWIFGFPKKALGTFKKVTNLKIDVEDCVSLIFEYPKKLIQLSMDFIQQVPQMEIKIVFSKATIYADLINQKLSFFNKKYPKGKLIKVKKFKNGNEIYLKQMDFLLYKSFKNYKPKFKDTASFKDYSDSKQSFKVLKIIDLVKNSNLKNKKINL